MEAVGESHHQTALAELCGGHSRRGHDLACVALLVPEPDNPHDGNAHRITIEGQLVGYVPRDQAARLAAAAAAVGRAGAPIAVDARIRGGWRTNQHDEGYFGVRLAVPTSGDVVFEGHTHPPRAIVARKTKTPHAAATPLELTAADLETLDALIRRLQTTPLLPQEEAERRRQAFSRRVARRMLAEGVSSGIASGAPDHLTQGEDHFRAEMARMDNLLGEQVRVFQQGLDQWFQHGETFPPYHPFRIAVILRKAKRSDLEREFLAAYVEHFAELRTGGSRYAQILVRAEKMGIAIHPRDEPAAG